MILFRGPSLLEPAAEIVVVATTATDNRKTGPMLQTWILRTDRHPVQAVKDGSDRAICGDCSFRGSDEETRLCYVQVAFAPGAVYRALQKGEYEDWTGRPQQVLAGQLVRVGAYGDPAAVPFLWWRDNLMHAKGHTAYTHQWRTCDQRFQEIAMASVESVEEQIQAQARGWRTYRVRRNDEKLSLNEITCPASDEAGHRTTCARCLLCDGAHWRHDRRKSIAIQVHGTELPFYDRQQMRLL
jgi:hypothetical protein